MCVDSRREHLATTTGCPSGESRHYVEVSRNAEMDQLLLHITCRKQNVSVSDPLPRHSSSSRTADSKKFKHGRRMSFAGLWLEHSHVETFWPLLDDYERSMRAALVEVFQTIRLPSVKQN